MYSLNKCNEESIMGLFDGKVALVTGGPSGIGQATAVAFARESTNVALTYHFNRAGGDETVRLLVLAS
jgi:NAD(P)-dependent dehydrogenase (short-subunit alcohol dehydrogenase family)